MIDKNEAMYHMARTIYTLALWGDKQRNRDLCEWMSHPEPGDLVYENSAPYTPISIGTLVKIYLDTDMNKIYKIIPLDADEAVHWWNCEFIRVPHESMTWLLFPEMLKKAPK